MRANGELSRSTFVLGARTPRISAANHHILLISKGASATAAGAYWHKKQAFFGVYTYLSGSGQDRETTKVKDQGIHHKC